MAKSAIDSYSESNGTEQDKQILLSVLLVSVNNSKPKALVKTVYTGLMGGATLGEGFLSFFEDVGDCAIVLGSGVAGFFDKKKSQEMRIFASKIYPRIYLKIILRLKKLINIVILIKIVFMLLYLN